MIKRITLILLSFFYIINAQIALPTFQGVHKPQTTTTTTTSILVYYDSFTSGQEPSQLAGDAMGLTVSAHRSNASAFASAYDSEEWDIVIIDIPGSSIPNDVKTRVLDRLGNNEKIIFSYWKLNSHSDLKTALEVSTSNYSSPRDIYPTNGASINLFTNSETVTSPLENSHDAGINGQYLTATSGGEALFSAGSGSGSTIGMLTNSGSAIVLGFLPYDFQSTNADSDGNNDIVELFVNMLSYL